MIDEKNVPEMNKILWYHFQDGCSAEDVEDALTAIYEIGLGVIGEDEKLKHNANQFSVKTLNIETRNALKASQRKAWAKACGVPEK